jgi:hypothetical protein
VSHMRVESHDRAGGTDVSIDTPAGHLSVHAHERPGAGGWLACRFIRAPGP